jgi:O-antigen/teichoic acid export membrane protein
LNVGQAVRRLIRHFQTDTLFQNSVYLMLSTLVQAVLGFAFWLLNARLFAPDQIGLASALISASTFIAYLSLLGFNSTFIRFLPTSKQRNDKLNTGLSLVLVMATAVSIMYVIALPMLAPKLAGVVHTPGLALSFVVLSALGAGNLLTDSVFIAYRAAAYNLLIYSIQSVAKLALPFALVGLGAYGVFASSGLAAAMALFLSAYFMMRRFAYRPRLMVSEQVVRTVWHFSSGSYVANLFNIVPTLVLPVVIVNQLGAVQAGYFYLAFMLANLVYAVPYAVCQSLFAEGSYGDVEFRQLVKRAVVLLTAIIVPAALGLALVGPLILGLFGKAYTGETVQVLVWLAVAAPAVSAYVLGGVLLRLNKQIAEFVVANVLYAVLVSGLALLLAPRGLVWVPVAWLVGNLASAAAEFGMLHLGAVRRISAARATAEVAYDPAASA